MKRISTKNTSAFENQLHKSCIGIFILFNYLTAFVSTYKLNFLSSILNNPLWKEIHIIFIISNQIIPWSKSERLLRKNLHAIDAFVYHSTTKNRVVNDPEATEWVHVRVPVVSGKVRVPLVKEAPDEVIRKISVPPAPKTILMFISFTVDDPEISILFG